MLLGWLLLLATTSASSSGSDKVVSFYLENGLPYPLPHPKGGSNLMLLFVLYRVIFLAYGKRVLDFNPAPVNP